MTCPLRPLWNGHFAVAVFFALSGSFSRHPPPRTAREAPLMIGLRYVRLAVPALISSAIAWAWLSGFPRCRAGDAGPDRQFMVPLDLPAPHPAFLAGPVGRGHRRVIDGTTKFNNPLWTMRAELIGSLLIYGPMRFCLTAAHSGHGARLSPASESQEWPAPTHLFSGGLCGGALLFELRARLMERAALGWPLFALALTAGGVIPGHAAGAGCWGRSCRGWAPMASAISPPSCCSSPFS